MCVVLRINSNGFVCLSFIPEPVSRFPKCRVGTGLLFSVWDSYLCVASLKSKE